MADELPSEVQRLIAEVIASMDHVEVLRRLSAGRETTATAESLAGETNIATALLARVLHDLQDAHLIGITDGQIRYSANARDDAAVQSLIHMYNTRPVTLVRAVYARLSPVRTFADAFRIRRDD